MSATKQDLITQLDKVIAQYNQATDKAPAKLEGETINQVQVNKAIQKLVSTFESKKALHKRPTEMIVKC